MSRAVVAVVLVVALAACTRYSGTPTPATTTVPVTTTATSTPTQSATVTTTFSTTTTTTTATETATTTKTETSATAPPLPDNLTGTDWERIPTSRHIVALTFDAGANDSGVAKILDTLAREQVAATFFLTGSFVDQFPASTRAMARYRIGNHSMTHPYFTELSEAQIRSEINAATARIKAVSGADPAPWFRFPFGDRNSRAIDVVNSLGYVPVRWTVDTLGWKGTSGGQSVTTVRQRVLDTLSNGQIVLMHVGSNPDDGSTLDADALPGIIDQLRARGYSFVTLDAFLG